MATNPYAAPKAAVADETVVVDTDFIPGGQSRPIGHGWRWISDGTRGGGAVFWGLFVGLSHPMAGVTLGAGLFIMTPVALVKDTTAPASM